MPRKGDRAVPVDGRSSPHRGLARLFPNAPPPGPFRRAFWSSPLRGPWLTAILGTVLLGGLVIVTTTGFLSHAAYNPSLGQNAIVDAGRDLPLTFDWPTRPAWLYALSQGLHVLTAGVLVYAFAVEPSVLGAVYLALPVLLLVVMVVIVLRRTRDREQLEAQLAHERYGQQPTGRR